MTLEQPHLCGLEPSHAGPDVGANEVVGKEEDVGRRDGRREVVGREEVVGPDDGRDEVVGPDVVGAIVGERAAVGG